MFKVKKFLILIVYGFMVINISNSYSSSHEIRVFAWEGYVIPEDIKTVNNILKSKGYKYKVKVIQPWAVGPEQMYDVLKRDKADISFLTLNYIKMQNDRILKLLQPINIKSPRLTNYKYLDKSLPDIPMGIEADKYYYVPWGGGAYGIWANMKKLTKSELPTSVKDLLDPQWKEKISLTKGQIQPNIALVMLILGKPPFYLYDIRNKRSDLLDASFKKGEIQKTTNKLYQQVGVFWEASPNFKSDNLILIASYGVAASAANKSGGNWQLVKFKEGNTVWLDTINFHKDMKGKKLEAAEIFLNYFIGKKVQTRVANELGMVAVSKLVAENHLNKDGTFFVEKLFWPPYTPLVAKIMTKISNMAMATR